MEGGGGTSWRDKGDKGDGLSWELTGFFNKYLVGVYDASTPLWVLWMQQRTKWRKKKKICPEALGTLNKVIKGGFSKEVPSDLKDKGAGPGRTRGMKSGDGVTQGSIGPK